MKQCNKELLGPMEIAELSCENSRKKNRILAYIFGGIGVISFSLFLISISGYETLADVPFYNMIVMFYEWFLIKATQMEQGILIFLLVFSYFLVFAICLMVLEFVNRFMSWEYRGSITEIYREDTTCDNRILELKAYHEAGHYVIAKILNLPIKEVNIISNGNTGGQCLLDMPNILKSSQIKSMVMVKYAGFISERILNGEISDGCMGCNTSDMESSNRMLRTYVILTDTSISLTGYEDEYIRNRCIELSKLWEKEVEELLRDNVNEIKKIAEQLIENKVIKVA